MTLFLMLRYITANDLLSLTLLDWANCLNLLDEFGISVLGILFAYHDHEIEAKLFLR